VHPPLQLPVRLASRPPSAFLCICAIWDHYLGVVIFHLY
jgi:hypothetical protein